MPSQASHGLVQVQISEHQLAIDDVAFAPREMRGAKTVLRMMVGDGVCPRGERSGPRIFRAGRGRRP
jgi:hypothetical protein